MKCCFLFYFSNNTYKNKFKSFYGNDNNEGLEYFIKYCFVMESKIIKQIIERQVYYNNDFLFHSSIFEWN